MLISQLSKITHTPIHTIRYYEKYGLFKGKKKTTAGSNKYTEYDEKTVDKLELIEEGKSIGLSLSEIKELIDVWFNKRISTRRRIDILQKQRKVVDHKIVQLNDVRKRLDLFIDELEKFN